MNDSAPRAILPNVSAARFRLRGLVQGCGVRPAVARLASELALSGSVANDRDGVAILVEGTPSAVESFAVRLAGALPSAARVDGCDREGIDAVGDDGFSIVEVDAVGPLRARIPTDRAVCPPCLDEVRAPDDRRHAYPFAACTACGPRYSIVDRLPYERDSTTMRGFPPCEACRAEFESPSDRRCHAQVVACGDCGPRVFEGTASPGERRPTDTPIDEAARRLRGGGIVAVRGLGGYQLLADAKCSLAVRRLREGKRRPSKPFALMISDRDDPGRWCAPTAEERAVLDSPENPIVVVRSVRDHGLADEIACGLDAFGLMRPTTPLHALLLDAHGGPLVATSGNIDGDPLVVEPAAAESELGHVADAFLHHDRPIRHPVDDSVVRIVAGRRVTIRLARGLAPLPLPFEVDRPGLAVGGQQKVALAVANGAQAVLGPHLGDLDSIAMRQRFVEHVRELCGLYDAIPEFVACDLHPDYASTRGMLERGARTLSVAPDGLAFRPARLSRIPAMDADPLDACRIVVLVQHHHAHVAAGMVEHGWLDREVLGAAFDGTGYGSDGTIWGGEFLRARATGFVRVGSLRPFRLVGGDRAAREPWRAAVALLMESSPRDDVPLVLRERLTSVASIAVVERLVAMPRSAGRFPETTSAGRLFDGVASLVLGSAECGFDGEPAMRLEAACDTIERGAYEMPVADGPRLEIDWRPAVAAIVADLRRGTEQGRVAMRFHRGLARAIVEVARRFPDLPLVLCGGVFQNRRLTELVVEAAEGLTLGLPGTIPPNDGGLAAGQLAVAAAVLRGRVERSRGSEV